MGGSRGVSELRRVRRASWKGGRWQGDRRLVTPGIDQIILCIKDNELGFLVSARHK